MNRKLFWLLMVSLIFVVGLAGCFGGDNSRSGNAANGDSGAANGQAPSSDPGGDPVPEDVPVMPGGYDLEVIREGSRVNYTVDQDVETVISFYQTELEALGWMNTRSPDSSVGAIGSMSRENEAGDKLTINMSYNANGGFSVISISILRAQ